MASIENIDFLRTKAQAWAKRVVDLYNTPVPAGTKEAETKKLLLSRAKKIKEGIEAITGNMESFDPLDKLELGFIPLLIGAGAVAASVAAIVKWNYDHDEFDKTMTEYNRLITTGMPPDQAAKIAGMINKSAPSTISQLTKLVGLALAGFLAVNFIGKKR